MSNESSTNCDDYTEDGSSGSSDDNGDNYTDGNASDDGTEAVCAICDQGGILLGYGQFCILFKLTKQFLYYFTVTWTLARDLVSESYSDI